jgi:glycosyltransferase involved in cell wall biosynthesis
MSITFICAIYNEEDEIIDLLLHVWDYSDKIIICDDGSIDRTSELIKGVNKTTPNRITYMRIPHTGLPETVKNMALQGAPEGWVMMLDADERFAPGVLDKILIWLQSDEAQQTDYVYFNQKEIIDGHQVRSFQKSKLFRKSAITFSKGIHEDDLLEGEGIYHSDWVVLHRKSTTKQIQREQEYLETYKNLLQEGKIDMGRYNWLVGLHHYIKE